MKYTSYILILVFFITSCNWFSKEHQFLNNINGVWVNVMENDSLFEHWKELENNKFQIKNYSLHQLNDTTIWMEGAIIWKNSKIEMTTNENVVYQAQAVNNGLIFSTNQVTYPQKVNYQLIGNDSLFIRYEGIVDGAPFQEDLYFKKIK